MFDSLEEAERVHEYNAQFGDPRRCPVHGVVISSPDGMFDALCNFCEAEGDAAEWEAPQWEAPQ